MVLLTRGVQEGRSPAELFSGKGSFCLILKTCKHEFCMCRLLDFELVASMEDKNNVNDGGVLDDVAGDAESIQEANETNLIMSDNLNGQPELCESAIGMSFLLEDAVKSFYR